MTVGDAGGLDQIALGPNRYGKSSVRLVTVARARGHSLCDLTVDVSLEGDFAATHLRGDNRAMLATDTMRNAVYALAKQVDVEPIEHFGRAIGRRLLDEAPSVTRARVRITSRPWARLTSGGGPHEHAFRRDSAELRIAIVTCDRDGGLIEGGIENLGLLRTTGSGWAGFLRNELTTLADTDDRILATNAAATWRYRDGDHDFDAAWEDVRSALLDAFADHDSPSVQFTLLRMGAAALAAAR